MPASPEFASRLNRILPDLLDALPTPFYVYDEEGIVGAQRSLMRAFYGHDFKQYFAVKALPNPAILDSLVAEGSGLDCSSPVELKLAKAVGASGNDIVFTPNNIAGVEYDEAIRCGALVTFDDRSALEGVAALPEVVSFRVGAGDSTSANNRLMGSASHTKFGVPRNQLHDTYRAAMAAGARRFGIHSMTLANELSAERMLLSARELILLAADLTEKLGLSLEYINFGGGPGIPYRPGEKPFDFKRYAEGICSALDHLFGQHKPRVVLECGRSITGPHGVLVTAAVSRSAKATTVIGVDACMSALMRPGMYETAYHHISSTASDFRPECVVDVVGALCENNDKFGIARSLPEPRPGDVLLVHDCGAHGHAMGFNYNGRLRPAELLLTGEGEVLQIRRAETPEDYLATLVRRQLHLQFRVVQEA